MAEANRGHAPGYGDDRWTAEAADLLRETFEADCEVFFVFNGTAANSLALSSLCQSYHSIICHETAHVETDECGAPEFFSNGTKVLTAPGEHGKLGPDAVEHVVRRRADIHYPKPRVVSVTQPTELGTVYTAAELSALGSRARSLGLRVHMDGARFANAVAALGVPPARALPRRRRRRPLPGRHQERHGGGRGGGLLRPGAGRASSSTAASRPASSPRRCASWPRPGSACCAAAPGCATPGHANAMAALLARELAGAPGVQHAPPGPGQRGVRRHPAGGGRGAAGARLAVLRLHRLRRRRASCAPGTSPRRTSEPLPPRW